MSFERAKYVGAWIFKSAVFRKLGICWESSGMVNPFEYAGEAVRSWIFSFGAWKDNGAWRDDKQWRDSF